MIRIDDSLLEELGLMSMPKTERDAMLKQIYETLEMRVGMKLAERMSDQQLDEFEKFIDGDSGYVEDYLNAHKPNWQQSEQFLKEMQNAQLASQRTGAPVNENAVKSQFGALTWLETNFPDYKQVVANELEILKSEIKRDSAQIVQAVGGGAPQSSTQQANVTQGNFGNQSDVVANQAPQQFQQTQPYQQPQYIPQPPQDRDHNQQPPMAA